MERTESAYKYSVGFTLVELAVVILIIGVLAAFGVPRFVKSVERSKAAEAFAYLSTIQSSQERYLFREGSYASHVSALDTRLPPPRFFQVAHDGRGTISPGPKGLKHSWTLSLVRKGEAAGYGGYSVVFTQDGLDATNSTILLHPEILPTGLGPNREVTTSPRDNRQ